MFVGVNVRKTVVKWYFAAIKKYAIFNGRSRRTEYWMFVMLNSLFGLGLWLLFLNELIGPNPVYIFTALIFVPTLSVTVRRLHDTNRSAWWLLLPLIPVLGELIFLVFMVLEGKPERNRFGPDPKRIGVEI